MFNLKPDANTFVFLMESLYINTKDRFASSANAPLSCKKEDIEDTLGASEIIVEAMEEAGVKKTKHFFHKHMRLFCALGLLEIALSMFREALLDTLFFRLQSFSLRLGLLMPAILKWLVPSQSLLWWRAVASSPTLISILTILNPREIRTVDRGQHIQAIDVELRRKPYPNI